MKRPTNIKQHRTISTDFKPICSPFRVLFGLVIYSFGVYLTIYANIGLAPWDCLGMGIAKHTPLNYGSSMVLIGVCAIVIQIILRERIGFATLFDALITGRLTQFFIVISPKPQPVPRHRFHAVRISVYRSGDVCVYVCGMRLRSEGRTDDCNRKKATENSNRRGGDYAMGGCDPFRLDARRHCRYWYTHFCPRRRCCDASVLHCDSFRAKKTAA